MSLIKKAYSFRVQARTENNPQKAMMLRKASADLYNQMVIYAFVYGVVTQDDNLSSVYAKMSGSGTLLEKIRKLIVSEGVSMRIANIIATEFFEIEKLSENNYYAKMMRDFTSAFKSKSKAEDAIQNIFAGVNPMTEKDYREEAKNPFAHAGKEHANLPTLFKNAVELLEKKPNAVIESEYKSCISSIMKTLGLLEFRLKYSETTRTKPVSITKDEGTSTSIDTMVDKGPTPEAYSLKILTEGTVQQFTKLFQKGYGWKSIRSPQAQRRAISHILFCMHVHYERADLETLISNNEEMTLLNQLDLSPEKVVSLGTVQSRETLYSSLNNLVTMTKSLSTDFLDELNAIYSDINEDDDITVTVSKSAFVSGWKNFLSEIGNDIKALGADTELSIPSASSLIEDIGTVLKQGSKKKASTLKNRVASLLRRYYNQI